MSSENGSILVRRGPTTDRDAFTPLNGEIIYDTTTGQLHVGDAQTAGGTTVFGDKVKVDSAGNLSEIYMRGEEPRPAPVEGLFRYNALTQSLEYSDGNTFYQVASSPFTGSSNVLYVSTNGKDDNTYGSKRGRTPGTAFKTLNAACREAQRVMDKAAKGLGPYQKWITYTNASDAQVRSVISSVTDSGPYKDIQMSKETYELDATTELRSGMRIVGQNSGAIGLVEEYTKNVGGTSDTLIIDVEYGEFLQGEQVKFGNAIPSLPYQTYSAGNSESPEITIRLETGIYYEHFPIKVPNNVSIKGDEFRRSIIRPRPGPSASPYSEIKFKRNADKLELDPDVVGERPFGAHYLTDRDNLIYTFVDNPGAYVDDYNVLFASKATLQDAVITFITSTYPSLTYDVDKCRRDVGYIVDALSIDLRDGGRLETLNNALMYQGQLPADQVTETAAALDYLATQIAPLLTTDAQVISNSFIGGIANIIRGTGFNAPKENDTLDVFLMNDATIIRNLSVQGHGGFMEVLDPEGQILTKSPYTQTCSSFSKSLAPKVSFAGGMFVDGFCGNQDARIVQANNTTEIVIDNIYREPQTPTSFFIDGVRWQINKVDKVGVSADQWRCVLSEDTPWTDAHYEVINPGQTLPTLPYDIEILTAGNISMLSNDFTQVNDLGYGLYTTNGSRAEAVSVFCYYCHVSYLAENGSDIRSLNGSTAYGDYALLARGSDPLEVSDDVVLADDMIQTGTAMTDATYTNIQGGTVIYVDNLSYAPYNISEVDVDHGGANNVLGDPTYLVRYEVISVSAVEGTTPQLYQLNIAAGEASNPGVQVTVPDGTPVVLRNSQVIKYDDILDINPTRPSTALQYDDDPDKVYRVLAYDVAGLPDNVARITLRESYDYVKLVVDDTAGSTAGSGQVGDTTIRLDTDLDPNEQTRIENGISVGPKYIFGFNDTIHQVTAYRNKATTGQTYAEIDVTPALTKSLGGYPDKPTLRAGLPAGGQADITVGISTLRVTGHDLLDIGTGSYQTSSYPREIYGKPEIAKNQAREVVEEGKGRVFFVTTDQDGNFRVGDYFKVDQGTGTVTFAASIALSNLDGIGFKRGVAVSEFSTDDGMTDNATDTVPVESAVRNYVNRRLGLNHAGATVPGIIGPGFLDLNGTKAMAGNLDMDSNNIDNISVLTVATLDATSRLSVPSAGTVASGNVGDIKYNTDTQRFEGYLSSNQWGSLGGVSDVDGDTYVQGETTPGNDNDDLDFYTAGTQRLQIDETGDFKFGDGLNKVTMDFATGNIITPGDIDVATLDVGTSAEIATLKVEDLTAGRVLLAGTDGEIEDSANLTFNGTKLTVDGNAEITGNVVIGGNITIGDTDTDSIIVSADFEGNLIPDTDDLYDLGTNTKRWSELFLNDKLTLNDYVLPLQDGTKGQLVSTDGLGQLGFSDSDIFGGKRVYVSAEKGNDANDGVTAPVATIKRAMQIASGMVYNVSKDVVDRATVMVATGEYILDNPVIIPDNVSIVGDSIRTVILRPANENEDMFRVRNASYMFNMTFRDALSGTVPIAAFRFAVAFDNPNDSATSRAGYTNLPNTRVLITTSPYLQNCSVISFLGANGVEIDGDLVVTPNTPSNAIEAENPVTPEDGQPEQGKSMVANAFTILSFGGVAWRVMNDAYAQLVSCFVIFAEQGCLTQNGGYLSITNSATNFGYFALRSTGYSPRVFDTDKGIIGNVGVVDNVQNVNIVGLQRDTVNQYVMRVMNLASQDVTNTFNNDTARGVTVSFTAGNASGNSIATTGSHGLSTGDLVQYNKNGNLEIVGLLNEATYYVSVVNTTSLQLFHDADLTKPVTGVNGGSSTGTHQLLHDFEEIFIDEVLSSHNNYQDVYLPAGSYTVTKGALISATSGSDNISATVVNFDNNILTVSVEKVQEGSVSVTNFFSTGAVINAGEISVSSVTVSNVVNRTDLVTINAAVKTTKNRQVQSFGLLQGNQAWLHRPSITNSSAHTWEYSGSGVDYNALPENGGVGVDTFEQYSDLPGRVYTSGTNELGDFKIGDFIVAFNRTGNIIFRNQVSIGELDSLALSLSGGVRVTAISNDPDLGDNDVDGALDSRLVTQLAVKSFMNDRLGNFIDRNVSTNAVPSAVVQLNSQGLINQDLIPPTGAFESFTVDEYGGRLTVSQDIPAPNISAGDIVVETYPEIVLNLTGAVTVTAGDTITQATSGATGIVKESGTTSTLKLVNTITGTFNTTDTLSSSGTGNLGASSVPTIVSPVNTINDNYFLKTDKISQFLVLQDGGTPSFTSIISNSTPIQGATSKAVATVTSHVVGVLNAVDVATLPGGSGYTTPGTYENVSIQGGSGSGAKANIIVGATGTITSFDVTVGGSFYTESDNVTINDADVGGRSGGSPISIGVTDIQNRLYVDLNADTGLQFTASNINLDFIVDDNPPTDTLAQQGQSIKAFVATSTGSGGDVDVINDKIVFQSAHGLQNGDPLYYDSNANTPLGGLLNNTTYYAKVLTTTEIELFANYGLTAAGKVDITASSSGTHNFKVFNVNQYANTFFVPIHGLSTGDAIKFESSSPPTGVDSGDFFFVGSVTLNSFTLHEARGAALDSVAGLTVSPINITSQGGAVNATLTEQNVIIVDDVNTSGDLESSWSSLSTTTIDAGNIISGVVDTSRLASGNANDKSFLRGDQTWATAVQSITNTTAGDPITLTSADVNGDNFYNNVDIKIEKASYTNPAAPSVGTETLGVASYHFDHFEIDANGRVTTKASGNGGVIDADKLDNQTGAYYLNPVNLSRGVPIQRGGTNLINYAQGDLLYAGSVLGGSPADYNETLTKLTIGSARNVLQVKADGTAPQWTNALSVATLETSSNVTIGGDLTVNGTTTTVNTETINLADNIILLNSNLAGNVAPTQNSGIEIERGNAANKTLIWNEGDDVWTVGTEKFTAGTLEGNLDWSYLQNVVDPVVTVTLTGDVTGTGTATMTNLGSATASFETTIAANSVALGTDTSGQYASTITAGDGISATTASADDGTAYTVSHADTSPSIANVDLGAEEFVNEITFDEFGHVLTVGSATVTAPSNAEITITAGTDLSTGGAFTLNQADAETITIDHADITRSDTTGSSSLAYAGTFDVIDSITSNARGHITAVNVKTLTMPAAGANDNTTYSTSVVQASAGNDSNPIIRLTDSDGTNDDITISGGGDVSVTRTSASAFKVEATFPTDNNTTYDLSLVDNLTTNDSVDIKLNPSSGTADLVTVEAGTNITIEVDGDNANGFIISSTDTTVDVDDTPVNGATTSAISSNWAFDNVKTAVPVNALFTDTNTNQLTTWTLRDSDDDDVTIGQGKFIKFVTATGALGTNTSGSGTTADPYVVTLTSPNDNTQLAISSTPTNGATTTATSSDWAFDNVKTAVPVDALFTDNNTEYDIATASTAGLVKIGAQISASNYYAVELDGNNRMYVNVPWTDTDTKSYTSYIENNQTSTAEWNLVFVDGSSDNTSAAQLKELTVDEHSSGTGGLTYIPGSATLRTTKFQGTATSAEYADLAEVYSSDINYRPGTVVMFGGEQEVTTSTGLATTKVAGVVSTDPAYLMNSEAKGVAVALKGRVPCYVVGPIKKGDLLVTSSIPGVACRSESWVGGAVIGKSIENCPKEFEVRLIEIAIGSI